MGAERRLPDRRNTLKIEYDDAEAVEPVRQALAVRPRHKTIVAVAHQLDWYDSPIESGVRRFAGPASDDAAIPTLQHTVRFRVRFHSRRGIPAGVQKSELLHSVVEKMMWYQYWQDTYPSGIRRHVVGWRVRCEEPSMAKDPYLENAVMDVLWNTDRWLTPRAVMEALPEQRAVGYTTVMTVLARLWKKGRLDRRREGRANAYRPIRSRAEHAALRMEEILDAAGERSVALARFADSLSASERRKLHDLLEEP